MALPDYDKFIIDAITGTLRKWLDKEKRGNVVWLHSCDITQLEEWATHLAEQYRARELHEAFTASEIEQKSGGTYG